VLLTGRPWAALLQLLMLTRLFGRRRYGGANAIYHQCILLLISREAVIVRLDPCKIRPVFSATAIVPLQASVVLPQEISNGKRFRRSHIIACWSLEGFLSYAQYRC
jgi:hypothetical protein